MLSRRNSTLVFRFHYPGIRGSRGRRPIAIETDSHNGHTQADYDGEFLIYEENISGNGRRKLLLDERNRSRMSQKLRGRYDELICDVTMQSTTLRKRTSCPWFSAAN